MSSEIEDRNPADAVTAFGAAPAEADGTPRPTPPTVPEAAGELRPPVRAPAAVERARGERARQRRPSFRGPRLADQIGAWRRARSLVELIVVTVILGAIVAAILAVAIGAIAVSIQHALKS